MGTPFFIQGNEACARGAIDAGVRFFAGYPITPSTEIAEFMAYELPKVGGKFIQMEDEIASMAAIIGASIAGVKSMTATSGPGFSLMQENIGYACMAEVPCVVVNVQRGGPATGLPTKVAQADVMQARWGTHGDHQIIALSPSSVKECYSVTIDACNMAELYRTPVIVLLDEVVGHMREKVEFPDPATIQRVERIRPSVPPEWYKPYEKTPNDVPPMAIFGEGFRYNITGLTHDESGFPTATLSEIKANIKRISRKIIRNVNQIVKYELYNMDDAEVAIFSYGCTARSAHEAMEILREEGKKVGFMKAITLWPFPTLAVSRICDRVKAVVVPELNLGQMVREVERVNRGRARIELISRVDGEMITPDHIARVVRRLIAE